MSGLRLCPLGYQQLTSIGSATPLSNVPPGQVCALLQAEAENVRWRDDGPAPTATVGNLLVAGAAPWLYTGSVGALQFIATTVGAIVNVNFCRISG